MNRRLSSLPGLAVSTLALAVLVACGGGGSSSTGTSADTAKSVQVQTYITDNLATEYSKVWVSLKKITATDASGAAVTLLDASDSPVVVNLSSLASVGQLMSSVSLPAGLYTGVEVTLANAVQLVSLDGSSTTEAKFAATGDDFVWKVRHIEFDAEADGQMVLDFNLAKFTYDAATGLVTPDVVVPKPHDAFNKFVHQKAEAHGVVASVDALAGQLTLNDRHLGQGIVVTLAADAVVTRVSDGQTVTLADVKAGDRVHVKGTVTPGATTADPVTVTATALIIEPARPEAEAQRAGGEGQVISVDGSLVTVSLRESSFLPGSDRVVIDIAQARFAHGQASDLAAGVRVEFRGSLSTDANGQVSITAALVDVEGAPSQHARESNAGAANFVALRGAVDTLGQDGQFTVTLGRSEGRVAAGTYTVNASQAVYAEGQASCLTAGAEVEALGTLADHTLSAKVLAVHGSNCGGQRHAEPAPAGPAR